MDPLVAASLPLPGDACAFRQEQPRDLDRLIHDSPAVVAEVQDEPIRALIQEILEGRGHFFGGRLVELEQRDVADVVLDHGGVRHGRDPNHGPGDGHVDGLRDAMAEEQDVHLRSGLAFQGIGDLFQGPVLYALPVDGDDPVAGLGADPLRRGIREDPSDHGAVGLRLDEHAHAGVVALVGHGELLELLGAVEGRVGVLEALHEAFRRPLVDFGHVQRVDVACGDQGEDVAEQVRPFLLLAVGYDEAAEGEGREQDRGEAGLSKVSHGLRCSPGIPWIGRQRYPLVLANGRHVPAPGA